MIQADIQNLIKMKNLIETNWTPFFQANEKLNDFQKKKRGIPAYNRLCTNFAISRVLNHT